MIAGGVCYGIRWEARLALAPGTRLGPYEILAPLGSGGMGEVYRARDAKLAREVAVKILPADLAADADRLARFEREAKTLAALNHPHIAHVYGFEESRSGGPSGPPICALVMELVPGESLAKRLARRPLPMREALEIARQIADALEGAHEKGIVHALGPGRHPGAVLPYRMGGGERALPHQQLLLGDAPATAQGLRRARRGDAASRARVALTGTTSR